MVLCLFGLCVARSMLPVKQRAARGAADDNRVYLIHADVLHYDRYKNPDAQILNGHGPSATRAPRYIATARISMRCPTRSRLSAT